MHSTYARILPTLRAVARTHGYALGLHGSTERDLDLIAVPWVETVSEPTALIAALAEAVQGVVHTGALFPFAKPHGRQGWVIYVEGPARADGGAPYLDVSVVPAPFGAS